MRVNDVSKTGLLKFDFSRKIVLPESFTEWTHDNIGQAFLSIEYKAAEETLDLIEP